MNLIDLKEFKDRGFLLEANRQFFHPLGLALAVFYDEDDLDNRRGVDFEVDVPKGLIVYDYRDELEGCIFEVFTAEDKEKAANIEMLRMTKSAFRLGMFGAVVQPLETPDEL